MAEFITILTLAIFWLIGGWAAIKLAKEFDTKQTPDNRICTRWFAPFIFATSWLTAAVLELTMVAVNSNE